MDQRPNEIEALLDYFFPKGGIYTPERAGKIIALRSAVAALRLAQCHHGWRGSRPKDGERIVTPCPSCGTQSIFIGGGGHLTCSMLEPCCKEPSIERQITALRERAERAESNTEMADGCLDEVRSLLEQLDCCHGKPHPGATLPMMYREWILCILAKERESAALRQEHAAVLADNNHLSEKAVELEHENAVLRERLAGAHVEGCACDSGLRDSENAQVWTDPRCAALRAGGTKP